MIHVMMPSSVVPASNEHEDQDLPSELRASALYKCYDDNDVVVEGVLLHHICYVNYRYP